MIEYEDKNTGDTVTAGDMNEIKIEHNNLEGVSNVFLNAIQTDPYLSYVYDSLVEGVQANNIDAIRSQLRRIDRFSDVEMFLSSSGFMDTSDSSGRTVIDQIRDASSNRSHASFTGNDRPEFHRTLSGHSQVCVERSSTNLFLNSDSLSTQNVTVTNDPYTVSFDGTGTITFSGAHSDSLEGEEGERSEITFTPDAGTLTCTVSGVVEKAQIEQLEYSTLYISTGGSTATRSAPAPLIENALPVTGTIAGVVDAVYAGTDSNHRTHIIYPASGSSFRVWMIGNSFGLWLNGSDNRENVFMPNEFDRIRIAYVVTYSDKRAVGNVMTGGNIYNMMDTTSAGQYNGDSDIVIGRESGRQTSIRFENGPYRDSIVRTSYASEDWKGFFESLTAGTSMQTKAHEMTMA